MAPRMWLKVVVPVTAALLALAACSSHTSTPAPSTDLYVDPATGLDTNPGTKTEPVKTIAEALKDFTPGETIVLDAGTYDEISGETWAYTLPAGVVLQANTSGVVLSSTAGTNGFTANADATIVGVTLTGFHDALTATGGALTLENATFDSNYRGIALSNSAKATLTNTDFTGSGAGADLAAASSLTMTGGTVTGLTNVAFYADGSASLSLNQVQVSNTTSEIVELRQSATAVLTGCSIDNASPQGSGGSSSLVPSDSTTLTLANTNVGDAYGYAILTYGSATVTIQGGSIYGNGYGGINASGPLTIDGTSITSNSNDGVDATGTTTITNAFIDNNAQDGIYYDGSNTLKVRGTELKMNKIGVELAGAGGSADLGACGDAGNNVLQSTVSGSVGLFADLWTNSIISAEGNTWNPSVQGADGSGAYGPCLPPVGGPQSGSNITIGSGVGVYL